jgi:RNA polymerase sigma-70 factor (ECF subfamily)
MSEAQTDVAAGCWQALAAVRSDAIRSLQRRGASVHDAEDHVHEAILRLGARPLHDIAPDHLRALLVRTALHIAIDSHRRRERQQQLLPRLVDPVSTASPEEVAADRSEARWLAGTLPTLGRLERRALMKAAAGNGVAEIARELGVDYKAAENALGRARHKLRACAAAVTVGLVGLLRRLRLDRVTNEATALTASALTATVLLLGYGGMGSTSAGATRNPATIAPMAVLQPVVQRIAPPPATWVPARATAGSLPRTSASAPSPTPPGILPPPPPPPWSGCPQSIGTGPKRISLPTPAPQIMGCVVSQVTGGHNIGG